MADTVHNKFDRIKVGGAADYAEISAGGVITYAGTAKRSLTQRPQLVVNNLIKIGATIEIIPTPIEVGVFSGYSMPVYNSDGEEMFFRMRVPYRWDGVTNPAFKMIVALSAAEDVGDKFKFQLDWNNTSVTGAIEADVVTVTAETTITAGHSAQYSTYSVSFDLDYDNAGLQQTMVARNNLSGRIRRIAASSLEVSNEIILLDWVSTWSVDKIFGSF